MRVLNAAISFRTKWRVQHDNLLIVSFVYDLLQALIKHTSGCRVGQKIKGRAIRAMFHPPSGHAEALVNR